MKKRLLFYLLLTLLTQRVLAQKNELILGLSSGLFSFTGSATEKTSAINVNPLSEQFAYTNNPYGSRNGLCYGGTLQFQRVTKRRILLGLGIGYEMLRSKVRIDRLNEYLTSRTTVESASGRTYLNTRAVNGYSYLGYRLPLGACQLDLTGGLDLAFLLKSNEEGKAVSASGTIYVTAGERYTPNFDPRPRAQATVFYRNIGVYLGYAYGIKDVRSGIVGGPPREAHSQVIRFGLLYRLKS